MRASHDQHCHCPCQKQRNKHKKMSSSFLHPLLVSFWFGEEGDPQWARVENGRRERRKERERKMSKVKIDGEQNPESMSSKPSPEMAESTE